MMGADTSADTSAVNATIWMLNLIPFGKDKQKQKQKQKNLVQGFCQCDNSSFGADKSGAV